MNEVQTLIVTGYGANAVVTRIMSCTSAKRKNQKNHGTIILATVKKGLSNTDSFSRFVQGDKLFLHLPSGEVIEDTIVRIEKNNKQIISAWPGNDVGFCLKKTKLGQLIGKVPEGIIKEKF